MTETTLGVAPHHARHRGSEALLGLPARAATLALLPVAALAAATLWYPEHGDEALFVVGARALNEGATYYRDFWDLKQPGLYWIYQVGELVGPAALGTRVIEAALAVVAGLLVLVATAGWTLGRRVRIAAPTLTLGPYLAWSYVNGVGQIEGFMNVLLLVVIAGSWPARPTRSRSALGWAAAGAAIGVTVLLKTLYAPLAALPLLFALATAWRLDRRQAVSRLLVAVGAGCLPVALALAWLAREGTLRLALYTTFDLPAVVAQDPDTHPAGAIAEWTRAATNLFVLTAPLALAAVLGARRRSRSGTDLTLAATAALGLALAVPQLWTPYRFLVVAAPVGLLAVQGVQVIVEGLGRLAQRRAGSIVHRAATAAFAVAVVALAALTVRHPVAGLRHELTHPGGVGLVARVERADTAPTAAERAAAVVAARVAPRTQIYVLGDPQIMLLLDARQGAEVTGWSMEMLPAPVWQELTRELDRSRPRLLYVDRYYREVIAADPSGPALMAVVDRVYRPVSTTDDGTWYETTTPGTPLPAPDGVRLGRA